MNMVLQVITVAGMSTYTGLLGMTVIIYDTTAMPLLISTGDNVKVTVVFNATWRQRRGCHYAVQGRIVKASIAKTHVFHGRGCPKVSRVFFFLSMDNT